jgi:NADP-dependent 3-hydroxy acid dehydrogenase YdfG
MWQEVAGRRMRVSMLKPAADGPELFPPEVRPRHQAENGSCQRLSAGNVADAIGHAVTRPAHVAMSELNIRPAEQERWSRPPLVITYLVG